MAVLFAIAVPGIAAEKAEEDIWSENKPEYRKLTDEKIERIMKYLEKIDPEKARELAQLQEKEPEKFKAELKKVMHEEFGENHRGRRSERKGRRSRRVDGMSGMPGPGMPCGHGGGGGIQGGRGATREYAEYIEWLEKNYPEQAQRLADLKEKDSGLCMRQMGLGMRKYRKIMEASKENPELAVVLKQDMVFNMQQYKLLREIRSTEDEGKKKELVSQLEDVLSSKFDLIVRRKQIEYEQLRKKLEELKKEVEQSEAKVGKWKDAEYKQTNVKARLEELLGRTEKFRWD